MSAEPNTPSPSNASAVFNRMSVGLQPIAFKATVAPMAVADAPLLVVV